ncbi:MAG: ATP-binding protein [Candidatus Woesearchaeota archaeon]|jgi:DNA helicase HerA-like ATPase|nr:ATP-binding protein [Candidatus Woesearchaeota archaeon]
MLARLFGKSNTYKFRIEIFGDIKTFDFLKVEHHDDEEVLTQVYNITRDGEKLIGDCKIIGYRDSGVLKNIRTPFTNDAKIDLADDDFIEDTVGLTRDSDAFIGVLEHHPNLRINLDLKKTITKHIAILAKSGAGKSYTVGVLLEEVIKKNIPIVILDPHNEYATIKYPNTDKRDMKRMDKFGIKSQGFLNQIKEYSPDTNVNPQCEPITLDLNSLKPQDLIESLPQKLSPAQQGLMFNVLSSLNNRVNFDELIFTISNEESNSKWSLITLLEELKKLRVYSTNPTPLNEIVKHKRASIISLKGVEPYVQETFVSGLIKSLFEARKKEEIPPFLLVLEEAHNFCPERSFGELKTSKIIRTIAGEGRKFGVGLCVISQRPAKVDKNVVSQCSTQIILKITNPNDIKSVISSSEGVDSDSENEIQKLNIGTCLLTGVIDIPLKVNIRPRISKHGGETIDITLPYEVEDADKRRSDEDVVNNISFGGDVEETREESRQRERVVKKEAIAMAESKKAENNEFLQYVAPEVEIEDAKVLLDSNDIETQLVSGVMIKMRTNDNKDVSILFDKVNKKVIKKIFPFEGYDADESITQMAGSEKKLFKTILTLSDKFNPAELLIKTDMMFNEILRVCDSLANKGLLKKKDRDFELVNVGFAKHLGDCNFYGNQKFEEVSYDKMYEEKISNSKVEELFSMFGTVENMKDIFILRYVGK